MTAEQKLLLEYIRQSQFPGEACAPAAPTVDNIDWQQLFKEAQAQSVAVLVAGEVPMSELPADVQARWQEAENRHLVSYIRYMAAQNELTALLRGAGIPFAVLKGLAAAVYYREPSKRAMGDIDFIVPPEQFERTKALMIEAGYVPAHEDIENPRHDAFSKGSVLFELHHY
ncbi:MAG: nucleotidyltransferase family protein, partial [Clostridia bacterium]|nr:nucleotidyltransferase family protein [Clostridia bacterium]